ncbi:hypothetical protein SNE510_06760 [Streptomyces sp. NE5-10]|uniref:hypothetical protein n=1 Tax=Streptomyces sp. NE5-10 TaxID=2759674 RepID=UPI00190480F7|nr:hypothetical protein [Streptomyces sp. NE5-10]GHJ91157.1 hypothetical protein SNE510_06760 [Streptomyces sp. NE5-10]
MSGGWAHEVEAVLADGGYGGGSGLVVQESAEGVLVSWSADALIRPTILAHASDPALHARVTLAGMHSALEHALAALFLDAGFRTTVPAEGVLLVTRMRTGARPRR